MRGKELVPRFLHRSLSTQTYFRSSLFLLPGGEKRRPEIHLHSQATYTEVNLKNSYLMYVCRQLLHHPEGESEGLSLNQDLFLRIAHPKSRGGRERRSMSEICYVPGVSSTSRRVRIIKTVARQGLLYFVISEMSKIIYNYPSKER